MTESGGHSPAAHQSRTRVWRRRPTIKSVALAALLLTASVWLFTGYYFVQRVRALEREAAEVNERYAAAEALLGDVRRDLDHAAISLRDALIDVRPGLEHYRGDVDSALQAADDKLATYRPVLGGDVERQHVGRLRQGIQSLRRANHNFLAIDAGLWKSSAAAQLLDQVTPKRDSAIRVSADLQRLNRDAYLAHQKEMARVHGEIHQRSWQTLIFGAVMGLAIGLAATLRVTRLERQLRGQQQRDAANAAALQDLSTRLVHAQEEERQSLARELHDGVGQLLTALKLELCQMERRSQGGPPLADARALADEALTAVRDVSHLLHPPELQRLGLIEAIQSYVKAIRRRQDVDIEFVWSPLGTRLDAGVELAVYRIVQEAVTNVLRHAQAHRCRISLTGDRRKAVLTITDDGIGFSDSDDVGEGMGLIGIRERVEHAGGVLRVESAPGRGTSLTAEFPLPDETPPAPFNGAPALAPAPTGS
jgi:signal transduction histidine kinase